MLPVQILLNNLPYVVSEMPIPLDVVDGLLLLVFRANEALFQTGWFIERSPPRCLSSRAAHAAQSAAQPSASSIFDETGFL
jgi:hypothetical protein